MAGINHILLEYVETDQVYDWIIDKIGTDILKRNHILGQFLGIDLLIWVVNFAIYKAHL